MTEETGRIGLLGEEYRLLRHECGMRILLVHKDFNTGYGIICTPFGSVDEDALSGGSRVTLPDGSAHFLEHKLFENPDGIDTFARFSAVGADANAYTGYDRTCYLFSTAESMEDALDVLLSSVFTPHFTDKNVKKEKGIILQELKMYRDDQGDRIGNALMRAMYESCRVRKDIVGSIGSVNSVKKEDLYRAYDLYYRPQEMILVLCGRFDESRVKELINRHLAGVNAAPPVPRAPLTCEELPVRVKKRRSVFYTGVTTPVLSIGIKLPPAAGMDGKKRCKLFYELCVLGYALFAPGCPYVAGMRRDNLLPRDTGYDVTLADRFAHILFDAPCYRPEEAASRFFRTVDRLLSDGIDKKEFERAKKMLFAEMLGSFDSGENIAHFYLGDLLDGIDPSVKTDVLTELTAGDVERTASDVLRREAITQLFSLPLETKKGRE